jgi:phosphoribosylformimino-5-aminoimidazole carboxamide ribotide isomerase
MLIPSIDLQGGRIVQLVQGEKLAIETSDIDAWIDRLRGQPKVQLIDLDAAKGNGNNESLVARICGELPCRVGGGIRTPDRAKAVIALGATKVIVGSALFNATGVDFAMAQEMNRAVGTDRLIAAVDGREGLVVIHGWRTRLALTPAQAARMLEPFAGEFLYTHVDREGLMQGTDMAAIEAVRRASSRALTAAGGITTYEEIEALDQLGVDAVVGMALYTGRIGLNGPTR